MLQDEIASLRGRSVVVPHLPCATSRDAAYYLKVILRTSRHVTADADHRAGYVNTDNCVT